MSAHASTGLLNYNQGRNKRKRCRKVPPFFILFKGSFLSSGSGCKVVAAGLNNVVDHMVCFFVVDPICKDGVV
jgi:hypothetical protein